MLIIIGITGMTIILVLVFGSVAEKIAWAMGKRKLAKRLRRWTPLLGLGLLFGLILVSIGIGVHAVATM